MASRKEQKEQARARRLEQERQAAAKTKQRRRYTLIGGAVMAAVVAAVVVILVSSGGGGGAQASSSSPGMGFEGVPLEGGPQLASAGTTQTGTVDGISCGSTEQLAYHIHTHLAVFVNGKQQSLPGGIGIPGSTMVSSAQGPVANGGSCIYWLHTHTSDGIIHIESPIQKTYTLGNFFDEWHQPLSSDQVATAKGKVTAVVNGKAWTKSPRAIPFRSHEVVQLSVGKPVVPFQSVSWSGTGL